MIAGAAVITKPVKARRLIIPEVVQTSAMDCGPASLKSLLGGFGVPLSYGRLREACQTDVDGTSINTIEEIALQLGLDAEQTMMPVDHVLLPEAKALPAIIVISLPSGSNHFVVAWRRHGRYVQVMDPATGRRWPVCEQFLKELFVHRFPVAAAAWRKWAGSEGFIAPLRRRLTDIARSPSPAQQLIDQALADSTWRSFALLDAVTRMAEALVRSKGLSQGEQAGRVLRAAFDRASRDWSGRFPIVPAMYWSVDHAFYGEGGTEYLTLKGAVLVRVRKAWPLHKPQVSDQAEAEAAPPPLSPELLAAFEEPPIRPVRELVRFVKADGLLTPAALVPALALTAGGIVFEALLFRGLLDIGQELGLARQRLGALAALLVFVLVVLLLELPIAEVMQRLGRHLEMRLRAAFLEKLPRLGDRYFRSRLIADMAERSHSLYAMRLLPGLGAQLLRAIFGLALTTAAIAWLDPASTLLAILAAIVSTAIPLSMQPFLAERDLRVRTHTGALMRFYLDALLGLMPIRALGAERAVRREHEGLLVEWVRSSIGLQRRIVAVEAIQSFIGFALAGWILFSYMHRAGQLGSTLLLIYWGLSLPALGQQLALLAQQYPVYRNTTLRLLEPLGAPEERRGKEEEQAVDNRDSRGEPSKAVCLKFEQVNVRAAGQAILEGINLQLNAGTHAAIIGPSGAGKSSLVGLLLGWHSPANGRVLVDGLALDETRLEKLRRETVWVDPTVQLWNRSLLENLRYGAQGITALSMSELIELAQLGDVLKKLPDGFQTRLGESGALVSGGEGQRVRFARAALRGGVRLVILDEPFRGIDHQHRRRLLSNARGLWPDATLLCITHDVSDTQSFDRVIVVEQGRVVEDGAPAELIRRPGSRFGALVEAEKAVREGIWESRLWRRLRLDGGTLSEDDRKRP